MLSIFYLTKFVVVLYFLIKASEFDLRFRRVPNSLWALMIYAGLIFVAIELMIMSRLDTILWLTEVIGLGLIAYVVYSLGFWCAGDLKGVISLAIIYPLTPQIWSLPLFASEFFVVTAVVTGTIICLVNYVIYFVKRKDFMQRIPFVVYLTAGYVYATVAGLP